MGNIPFIADIWNYCITIPKLFHRKLRKDWELCALRDRMDKNTAAKPL
jgi:hypothetical protein